MPFDAAEKTDAVDVEGNHGECHYAGETFSPVRQDPVETAVLLNTKCTGILIREGYDNGP